MPLDPCEISPSYVRSIAPYQPGKPISELARELGLKEETIVKLASNENPRGPVRAARVRARAPPSSARSATSRATRTATATS
jgi:histidinol-phosphate aminotransferase